VAEISDDVTVRDLARLVVSQVAPEELPVFPVLADACLADPGRMLGSRDDVRERLGFGVGEIMALTTPFAILAAEEVVKYLARSALEVGRTVAGRIFVRRSDDSRRQADHDRPLELRVDQLRELRRIVLEKALQLELSPAKAELLADATVGSVGAASGGG
jgi:hypothetical protein